MKLRSGRRKTSESPIRKVKLSSMPLKKPKEKAGARVNRRSVKSDGLVKKNVEGESDHDPQPSSSGRSRLSCSRRQVSSSSVSDIEIGPGSGVMQLPEEVLRHIFGFLTFADVKSARLVNKHWRQVATTLLRRSSKPIELDSSVSECITKMGDGQFPVNRLEVRLFADNDYYDPENTENCLASFPGIICAWVKELTLSVNVNKLSPVQVLDDLVTFPTDCVYKDLTHFNLQVIQQTDCFHKSSKRFTDFVRSILEKSPNLREVNVAYKYESSRAGRTEKLAICPVIENIFPTSNSVGTSKLSYINFEHIPLEEIDLAKWSTLNLKLRKLGLTVSRFSKTNELLKKFLETQTGTLKHLTLNLNRWDSKAPSVPFTFPRLEKLEQLRVICKGKYAPATFADIDYARMFPCLKKLDLKDDRHNWMDFLGNDLLEPTDTVEELIFPCDLDANMDVTSNPAVIAAKIFTGLKKLEMYDADRVFTDAVYGNMQNLEVLTLSKSFDGYDDIITGLKIKKCRKFKGVMTKRWIEKLQNAEGRSMARLQNLKTLKLTHWGWGFDCRLSISRLSFHVFKKMSSLKCLDLFDGSALTAERFSADEDQKQFLEELRANFVVL